MGEEEEDRVLVNRATKELKLISREILNEVRELNELSSPRGGGGVDTS